MTKPAFVLIQPQMGENIGAAARAMLNFGLDHMRITSPRDGWPNQRAVAMASGAGRVLDAAQIFDSTDAALADRTYTYATTARTRDLTNPVFTPEAAMADAAKRISAGEKVAVMFGPERAGLENADIARANAIINVPVNPEFASLNLAQCVLLTGYEWQRATSEVVAQRTDMAGTDWANGQQVAALATHYEDALSRAGFWYPEHKEESMKLNLRNFWSRMPMTQADVAMMFGIMRQMVRWKDRG